MKRNSIFSIFGALIIMSAVTGMSGCNQPNSASKNPPTPQLLNFIAIPPIEEAKLNALWEIRQQNSSAILYYAFKETGNNTIYVAQMISGSSFRKIPNLTMKFENGRIIMNQNGQELKYAVKENGNTLELYQMLGNKVVDQKVFILKKDTDPSHASWGNNIKTAP